MKLVFSECICFLQVLVISMVAAIDAVDLNYATVRKHEFDLSADESQQRLQKYRFQWLLSNVINAKGKPFKEVPAQIIDYRLQLITDKIPAELNTAQVVRQWVDKAERSRANGFVPEQAIATTNVALDGLNSSIRDRATNLTALIAHAMLQEVDKADLAIFNSGSIQIDDYIPPGIITQYDIIRILPNGSKVLAVEMNGSLLQRVLEQGQANRGTGGYLQTANVSFKPKFSTWLIQGEALDPNRKYRVAINDFLMSGKEKGLEFLNFNQPGVRLIAQKRDIRFAVIEQLKDSVFRSTLMKSR